MREMCFDMSELFLRCPFLAALSVYVTARCPSVCRLYVSSIDSCNDVQLACCTWCAGGRNRSIAAGAAYRLSTDICRPRLVEMFNCIVDT